MAFENKIFPILLYNDKRLVVRQNADKRWEIMPQNRTPDGAWQDETGFDDSDVGAARADRVEAMVNALSSAIQFLLASDGRFDELEAFRKVKARFIFGKEYPRD